MVNYKNKYIAMKLKYINAKQNGGNFDASQHLPPYMSDQQIEIYNNAQKKCGV